MISVDIDGVVVNDRIFRGAGNADASVVIVPADVVADNGSDVADIVLRADRAIIADKQESAIVVMAVVVLNDGISAVPVRIKSFAIVTAASCVCFVVLNDGVIRAPCPDADIVPFRPLVSASNHVVLDQSTVGRDVNDAVPADVVQEVISNHNTQTWVPFLTLPVCRFARNAVAVHMVDTVVFDPEIDEAARLRFTRATVVNAASSFAVRPIHVVDR